MPSKRDIVRSVARCALEVPSGTSDSKVCAAVE